MKTIVISMIAATLLATPSIAQDRREMCAALAPSMLGASDGMGEMMKGLLDLDFKTFGARLGGEEGAKLAHLATLRDAMTPELSAFLDEFDSTALALRACAR
jgi:cytochrome c556